MANYRLTKEGKKYLDEGLPEKRLLRILPEEIGRIQKRIDTASIAVGQAKRRGWVRVDGVYTYLTPEGEKALNTKLPEELALEKIHSGDFSIDQGTLSDLIKRGLAEELRDDIVMEAQRQLQQHVQQLTPALIKSGLWKDASFKPYNVTAVGKSVYPGKRHLTSAFIRRARNVFLDLGFREVSGPMIDSQFWNFDSLFVPQDHPAREMQDTFFMKVPPSFELPDKKLVDSVRKAHEIGIKNSTGWSYSWDEKVAKKSVLRTHTTSVSARMLSQITPPAKIFCIGRVFRNETPDYKHLPEFTQVEGIVVDESVSFPQLLGYLKEFFWRMGFDKIRIRPGFFPYTEMSAEVEILYNGKWIEMGGAGILRPEVTEPLGITVPVLAWGLGLERLIMLRTGLSDVRDLYYKNDLEVLRKVVV